MAVVIRVANVSPEGDVGSMAAAASVAVAAAAAAATAAVAAVAAADTVLEADVTGAVMVAAVRVTVSARSVVCVPWPYVVCSFRIRRVRSLLQRAV